MTAQQYRQMMARLFEPFGFEEYQTNEPNICLKSENIFMARTGSNVSRRPGRRSSGCATGSRPDLFEHDGLNTRLLPATDGHHRFRPPASSKKSGSLRAACPATPSKPP
ncbi:MAG: hypothetical protein MZV70_12095 [Desulfobacterales bacterium]|nr:hypothetical protein [Desulfobacterales bacterium]